MPLRFFRRKSAPVVDPAFAPGTVWDGPAAVFDGPDVDHRRGIYALDPEGRSIRVPHVRLVAVDDTPGDIYDGAFHYEVAGPEDGMNKTCDGSAWPYKGEGVVFEPEQISGKAGVE